MSEREARRRVAEARVARLRAKYPQYEDDPLAGPVLAIDVDEWVSWEAVPG